MLGIGFYSLSDNIFCNFGELKGVITQKIKKSFFFPNVFQNMYFRFISFFGDVVCLNTVKKIKKFVKMSKI